MASAFDQKRLQAPLVKCCEQLRKYIAAIIGDDVFYAWKGLALCRTEYQGWGVAVEQVKRVWK